MILINYFYDYLCLFILTLICTQSVYNNCGSSVLLYHSIFYYSSEIKHVFYIHTNQKAFDTTGF